MITGQVYRVIALTDPKLKLQYLLIPAFPAHLHSTVTCVSCVPGCNLARPEHHWYFPLLVLSTITPKPNGHRQRICLHPQSNQTVYVLVSDTIAVIGEAR